MTEQEKKQSVEWGQEAPKDALSEVIKKLWISKEVVSKIQWLDSENKELCKISLQDILIEVEEQKLWPTDRDKKIQDTLDKEYNIKTWVIDEKMKKIDEEITKNAERHKILGEKLNKVKDLDKTIVSDELNKAKSAEPLSEETKLAIAKASNLDPSKIDESIKNGDNPQINNLVDTYYLTNANVQSAIEKRLPISEHGRSNIAFQELRASAREFPGLLPPFTAKNLPSRLSDKSEKTQQEVVSAFNSINKGNPNTLITRTGDKLRWDGADGKKYEIDMATRPLWLTKRSGILEIHQSIPDTRDVEAQAKIKKELAEIQWKNTVMSGNIVSDYQQSKDAIEKNAKVSTLSPSEIQGLMEIVGNKAKNTEEKQKACARLIEIYGQAENMPEFQAKIDDTEIMSVQSWLKDYFYSAKIWLNTLKKSLDNEMALNRKVPKKSEEKLVSAEEFEANTEHNLNILWRLGMGSFQNMDEVSAFLQTQNGVEVGGNWSEKSSINTYLWNEKLEWTQIKKVLGGLTKVHDTIRKDKVSELEDEGKMIVLNRSEWDGQTKLGKSLNTERIKKWGGLLDVSDFRRLLTQNAVPDEKSPQPKKH